MWNTEDDAILLRMGWAISSQMRTVVLSLGERHSADDCLKRYRELMGIEEPAIPEEFTSKETSRKNTQVCKYYARGIGTCKKKEDCDFIHDEVKGLTKLQEMINEERLNDELDRETLKQRKDEGRKEPIMIESSEPKTLKQRKDEGLKIFEKLERIMRESSESKRKDEGLKVKLEPIMIGSSEPKRKDEGLKIFEDKLELMRESSEAKPLKQRKDEGLKEKLEPIMIESSEPKRKDEGLKIFEDKLELMRESSEAKALKQRKDRLRLSESSKVELTGMNNQSSEERRKPNH